MGSFIGMILVILIILAIVFLGIKIAHKFGFHFTGMASSIGKNRVNNRKKKKM